ncbi:induced myeloid leukemia cell differentiation protein Mcl-1 [Orycteropus afer afer]|uniref:Induced myeloid leukemia cell differentiation protein Mcl-1 n=1 Tax=Orycteropus afer afer TaxID=1230840 RepID=A0A8B7AMA7_ORYAF|nr:induced myeloid leukemia cell differentiation protein Mcl-1 [Orycteropus afer afer]
MFGLKRNAVIGLNLYCGGAGLGAGTGGGATPPGGRFSAPGKEATTRREVGGGEVSALSGGSVSASPPAVLAPDALRVARPAPIGAEGPDVTASPARPSFFAPTCRASPPEEMEASPADAIMSPEEELDGYEPEPLGKRPAVLPLLGLVGEGSNGPGTDGSLPSTPPSAEEEEEEDELYRQSLEIISRYLREQATGAKDAKPMGGSGAATRKALETLRRVGDGVQRNHETAFQGMLRKLDIKNEDDVKSLSRVMVHVFSDGITNWGRIVTLISFGAFVAKHLKSINQESCIEPLAESITDVLVRTKRDWLVKQRGWDGFVEFFHVEDLEVGIRNVLLAFAGVAGVGAGLAYLIR